MTFIAALHVVMFMAGANGLIVEENGDNSNKQFIDDISSDELTNELVEEEENDNSSFIADNFSIFFVVKDFVFTLVGIITAPYAIANAAALPQFLSLLFNTLMATVQVWVVYRLVAMIA